MPTPLMTAEAVAGLIDRACGAIGAHEDELTRLDQAIGDGDHGANMARGFKAIRAARDELAALPFGEALQKAGMLLVTTVGGASGPLFGSLLMAMGKALAGGAALEDSLAAGIEIVRKRGKSEIGAKTMLDLLVPVHAALQASEGSALEVRLGRVRAAADAALEATRPMRATRGRASFLGERSVGHLDPGAFSARLLVVAVCDMLADKAEVGR